MQWRENPDPSLARHIEESSDSGSLCWPTKQAQCIAAGSFSRLYFLSTCTDHNAHHPSPPFCAQEDVTGICRSRRNSTTIAGCSACRSSLQRPWPAPTTSVLALPAFRYLPIGARISGPPSPQMLQHRMANPRDQQACGLVAGMAKQKQKSNPQYYGHFDAEDLSRRLEKVLREQKMHTDRKRAARAAAVAAKTASNQTAGRKDGEGGKSSDGKSMASSAASHSTKSAKSLTGAGNLIADLRSKSAKFSMRKSSKTGLNEHGSAAGSYHHVPQEAASQFTRTTTVDGMEKPGLTHKLAKHALKYHKEGTKTIRAAIADPNLTPSEQNRVLRHEQYHRQRNLDRNQFQRTRFLDEAADMDEEREKERCYPHTWEGELARLRADDRLQSQQKQMRRRSTGDVLTGKSEDLGRRSLVVMEPLPDVLEDRTPPPALPERFTAQEHRIDWSQEDQKCSRRSKLSLQPILKRADSIWTLKGFRGSKEQQPTPVSEVPHVPVLPDPTPLKPTKSGFFAKLKR